MKINLPENIRQFRKDMKLTQEQLAEAMGVSVGAVHKWETGLSTPEIGLIIRLADFFDTSVDVLLGYEMKDNRLGAVIDRLNQYYTDKDRRGLEEAEQALVKYPNSFWVVYISASLYMGFGMELDNQEWLRRALELLEASEKLVSQNDNPKINLMTIQSNAAMIYYQLGKTERAIDLLKNSNAGGHNDGVIGSMYTILPNGADQAKTFLNSALISNISNLLNMSAGYVKMYVMRKEYDHANEYLDWMGSVLEGLQKKDTPDPLDKDKAAFMVCRAYVQIRSGKKKTAKDTLKKAIEVAKRFDADPDYDMSHLRFLEMEDKAVAYDILGETALKGIDTMIKICDDTELAGMWQEVQK